MYKICICSDGYPYLGYSYSAFIQVLARELVRQNCEITVIAPQSLSKFILRGSKLVPRFFEDVIKVDNIEKVISIYRPYTLTFGAGLLGTLTIKCRRWATERIIRKYNICPDLYYSHFWMSGYNIMRVAKHQKKPLFVATGEDRIIINKYVSVKELEELQEVTKGVICVSSKNLQESVDLHLTTAAKSRIIPNAYDPREFYYMDKVAARTELGIPLESFVVAFCGRFNHRKGAMRVAAALNELSASDIKAIFIGSPADNEKEEPLYSRTSFKGRVAHDQIVKYLNCADVFVLPTLAEGCPNSVIEAMACGLPIISSNLPFNYDILNHGTAILINPNDIHEIANAIRMLKTNEFERKRLADASRIAATNLTIDKRVSKILEFISEYIERAETSKQEV